MGYRINKHLDRLTNIFEMIVKSKPPRSIWEINELINIFNGYLPPTFKLSNGQFGSLLKSLGFKYSTFKYYSNGRVFYIFVEGNGNNDN